MIDRPPFPPYSVFIPAFNAARTLNDAISSVLDQTVRPVRIIVVDDGSTDETFDIAAAFGEPVRVLRQANKGPAAATDAGCAALDSPFIAGLDADDVWFSQKAERQLEYLYTHPDVDAAFCRATSFPHGAQPREEGPARELWGRSAMMIRRSAAEAIGPVATAGDARHLGEMIRWLDLGRRRGLKFEMMPDILLGRRIIEGSLSSARNPAALLPMIRDRLRHREQP